MGREFTDAFRLRFLDIPHSQHELTNHILSNDETLKILELSWLPCNDAFGFVIASLVPTTPTRRSILLFIANLYNPLGWAAPYYCEDFAIETLIT